MKKIVTEFFSASGTADGGAYRYTLYDNMELICGEKIEMPCPQWIEVCGDKLCAALRDPVLGDIYEEYSISGGSRVGDIIPTNGKNVCHFCKSGDDVYFANYDNGAVSKANGKSLIQSGELGPMKSRQSGPHAHACVFSPDRKFVLACDLGLDAVIVYDRDLNEVSRAKVLPGHGARHAVFSADGKKLYVINELGSTVAEFIWNDGFLDYIRSYNMLDTADKGDGAEIVISADGKHLYATNRSNEKTQDYICHFSVGDELKLISRTPSMGNHPRHFTLVAGGKYAVCSNTFGGSMALFAVGVDGELEYIKSEPIPCPMCVCEIL